MRGKEIVTKKETVAQKETEIEIEETKNEAKTIGTEIENGTVTGTETETTECQIETKT